MQVKPDRQVQHAYSTQLHLRQKLSLQHLLSDSEGLARQYTSQQTQRTQPAKPSRPHTMYGERVRVLLEEEGRRERRENEQKARRQQSLYKLVKSQSGVEVRCVTSEGKIRMKRALGRVNVLAEGGQLKLNAQEQILAIFDLLQCLTQVENHYQLAFGYMFRRLKQLVFADAGSQVATEMKALADMSNNQLLLKAAYRNVGGITYVDLCRELLRETEDSVRRKLEAERKQKEAWQDSRKVIEEKQQLIKKLKRELKYYQEHPSQDLYPYVKKQQSENRQMKAEIDELLIRKNQNQYSIEIYEATNLLLSEQIESLKRKIHDLQLQQLSSMKQIEKNTELKIFQEHVVSLKEMLDKSKLKMEGMKDQFDKLKLHNEALVNQRSILAKRAAVGFGELTPRPNFKKIFQESSLSYEDFVKVKRKTPSTEQMCQIIVGRVKQYSEKMSKKFEVQKITVEKQEVEVDQWGTQELDYIEKTKQHLQKTIEAASEVKKQLGRQKQLKSNLDKSKYNK